MKTFMKFIIKNYMKLIKLGMCVYWYKQDQFQFVNEFISIINHQKGQTITSVYYWTHDFNNWTFKNVESI